MLKFISKYGKLITIITIVAFSLFFESFASNAQNKKVLILHSYHKGLKWTDEVDRGIRDQLKSMNFTEIFTEYLDTKRHFSDEYFELKKREFLYKFSDEKFNVVITTDDDALNFALSNHDIIFKSSPIVFCGVNHLSPETEERIKGIATGVSEAFDLAKTFDIMLKLHPKAKRIHIINDATTTGLGNRRALDKVIPDFSQRVEFRYLDNLTIEDLLYEVSQIRSNEDLIFLMTFNRDAAGKVISYDQSVELIAAATVVPIYGVWDFYLGKGIVGGCLTSGYYQGQIAGEMAKRILEGEKIGNIAIRHNGLNRYMFDYNYLVKFDINPNSLPNNSIIINNPKSFYEMNKTIVWFLFTIILLLLVIISILIRSHRVQKQLNLELKTSEAKYRSLFETMPDGYYRSTPDGRFVDANPAFIKMLGYESLEELKSIYITEAIYVAPEERDEIFEKSTMFSSQVDVYRLKRKDGTIIWVENHPRYIKDENGNIIFHEGICRDITDRKKAEEEILELNRTLEEKVQQRTFELKQALESLEVSNYELKNLNEEIARESIRLTELNEKLIRSEEELKHINDTKDKFFSIVAHDLRNPIGSSRSLLETILFYFDDMKPDELKKMLNVMYETSKRTYEMLENLLTWAKAQMRKIEFTPFIQPIYGVVEQNVKLFHQTAKNKEIQINNLVPNELLAYFDTNLIDTVIRNLLSNAIKFTPHYGTVLIGADDNFDENYIVVFVKDSGVGVEKERLEKLFEMSKARSTQGTAGERGSGLGLLLCKEFVEISGGQIWAESEPNKGTVIYFTLPKNGNI
ncbi:MAG TPA: ABC transporter substrate binding protein [Candidatus Kapabacteria bacterium]|nr:ABC transporter substrate binding protein [Candidatus Kapabacteria bacterium]